MQNQSTQMTSQFTAALHDMHATHGDHLAQMQQMNSNSQRELVQTIREGNDATLQMITRNQDASLQTLASLVERLSIAMPSPSASSTDPMHGPSASSTDAPNAAVTGPATDAGRPIPPPMPQQFLSPRPAHTIPPAPDRPKPHQHSIVRPAADPAPHIPPTPHAGTVVRPSGGWPVPQPPPPVRPEGHRYLPSLGPGPMLQHQALHSPRPTGPQVVRPPTGPPPGPQVVRPPTGPLPGLHLPPPPPPPQTPCADGNPQTPYAPIVDNDAPMEQVPEDTSFPSSWLDKRLVGWTSAEHEQEQEQAEVPLKTTPKWGPTTNQPAPTSTPVLPAASSAASSSANQTSAEPASSAASSSFNQTSAASSSANQPQAQPQAAPVGFFQRSLKQPQAAPTSPNHHQRPAPTDDDDDEEDQQYMWKPDSEWTPSSMLLS